jgi:hypothetical protein
MQPIGVGTLVFACAFLGSLAGMRLRLTLPQHHFSAESKETVLLAIGLIATMTALILGLVTASAKSSFDALDTAVKHVVADVLALDRVLARYGAGGEPLRADLEQFVTHRMNTLWPAETSGDARPDVVDVARPEQMVEMIRSLDPRNDHQRWLQSRALQLGESILEARWLVFSGIGASIPVPFMTVLVFWLTMIFTSFGLFAPSNGTVIATLFACALSVAGAIFLILEMDGPFSGVIRISPEPVHYAMARINR